MPPFVADTTTLPCAKSEAYASFNTKPIYHWLPFVLNEDVLSAVVDHI